MLIYVNECCVFNELCATNFINKGCKVLSGDEYQKYVKWEDDDFFIDHEDFFIENEDVVATLWNSMCLH